MASDKKQEFKKYLILTAAQLRRLRGEDPMRSKLEADRNALLKQATKKGSSSSDIAKYQEALRRQVAYTSIENEKPLSIDIDPSALAAAAATGETKDQAVGPGAGPSRTPPRRRRGRTPPRRRTAPHGPRFSTRPRHKGTQTGPVLTKTPRKARSSWLVY